MAPVGGSGDGGDVDCDDDDDDEDSLNCLQSRSSGDAVPQRSSSNVSKYTPVQCTGERTFPRQNIYHKPKSGRFSAAFSHISRQL